MDATDRPKKFDYNLVVIGAGSAGLVGAYIASALKARVALVEKNRMGGDCLNTGCVPSKALIRTAGVLALARRADRFGLRATEIDFDFAEVMERVSRVVRAVEPHDSRQRYESLGVEVLKGEARISSPWTVQVQGRTLTTRNILIATGARPFVPPIDGLDQIDFLTSDNLWNLRSRPRRLAVLGGGPIGCELSQAMARLGCEVTQVEMAPRILGKEDKEVSQHIRQIFEGEGIRVLTGHAARAVRVEQGEKSLVCQKGDEEVRIAFDALLVAVGRRARVEGFGLEELGLRLTPRGTVETDAWMRTSIPNIYCAGDAAGPYQFTHTASHQAWYATVNALLSPFWKFRADYSHIPWATFVDPEVARVGLSEAEARAKGIDYEVTGYNLCELDRAIADGDTSGFVKVLTRRGTDRILGAVIVGPHASDCITEYVTAMKQGLGLNRILGTIHIYPSLSEMNKATAGLWKKNHAPQKLLQLLGWVHRLRRK